MFQMALLWYIRTYQ